MDNQPKQQIVDQLKSANNVLIAVSANPSVDELAAAIGLTLALNKLDKHATTVFSGIVPSTLAFLQPDALIERTTDSLRDFIIALDKSKADKLRYKVEDDVVRIFITPYKASISEKDLEFSQGDFNVDVVIALGVTHREDLDAAITAHGRILHDATVVSLTNKSDIGELGSIHWQDEHASSLCEMVASIAMSVKDEDILDGQMATAFLTGIVAETDRFKNEKTTPLSMSMGSKLMSYGANQQLIAEKLEPEPPQPDPEVMQQTAADPSELHIDQPHGQAPEVDHFTGDDFIDSLLGEPVSEPLDVPEPEPVHEPEQVPPQPNDGSLVIEHPKHDDEVVQGINIAENGTVHSGEGEHPLPQPYMPPDMSLSKDVTGDHNSPSSPPPQPLTPIPPVPESFIREQATTDTSAKLSSSLPEVVPPHEQPKDAHQAQVPLDSSAMSTIPEPSDVPDSEATEMLRSPVPSLAVSPPSDTSSEAASVAAVVMPTPYVEEEAATPVPLTSPDEARNNAEVPHEAVVPQPSSVEQATLASVELPQSQGVVDSSKQEKRLDPVRPTQNGAVRGTPVSMPRSMHHIKTITPPSTVEGDTASQVDDQPFDLRQHLPEQTPIVSDSQARVEALRDSVAKAADAKVSPFPSRRESLSAAPLEMTPSEEETPQAQPEPQENNEEKSMSPPPMPPPMLPQFFDADADKKNETSSNPYLNPRP